VNTLPAAWSELHATAPPITVADAKSTICFKVAKTVGAENSARALPANELASSPYGGSSTTFIIESAYRLLRQRRP
jgi:hypothetical protein